MQPTRTRFVIWGYGSENLFRDFGTWLQAQGHEVLMLPDARYDRQAELEALCAAPYILLTSAHFGRDTRILHDYYPTIRIGNEFLDLLHHCPPLLSVFYPHDLATPLVINEPLLLDAFDLVLWPMSFFGYQPRPRKLVEVGWIGYQGRQKPPGERRYDSVLLFSDVTHHKQQYGIAGTCDKLSDVLTHVRAVKLPYWPGHDEYEAHFRSRGVHVIPAQTPAAEVITDSRLIVSNGLSGISVEAAYLGVPVINLLEAYLPPGLQTQFLAGLPGCVQCRYEDFADHFTAPPQAAAPCLRPFDPQRVLDLIVAEAAQTRMPPSRVTHIALRDFDTAKGSAKALLPDVAPERAAPVAHEAEGNAMQPVATAATPTEPQASDTIETATAQRLLAAGHVEEAFAILQALVQANTALSEPYRLLAQFALQQQENAIAEEFLSYACEREQLPAEAHLELAALLFGEQSYEDALSRLSPVIRRNPVKHADALIQVRRILGAAPELSTIAWARLIGDMKWQHP